uniref:Uncharacterized protein n=1 Tax=Anguilla anguilla TaxID=7936 RepID=A0A0E9TAR1_ANGAN
MITFNSKGGNLSAKNVKMLVSYNVMKTPASSLLLRSY